MINIAELLKDAPTGMKLYSPLFGEVEFAEVMDTDYVPIRVIKRGYGLRFDECGRYMGNEYPDSECLLFPSKDCRTWEGWKLHVEPKFKFKVEDWIVQNDNGTVSQITKTINAKDEFGEYRAYEHTNGYFAACFENEYHIWTIQDAKDGDVITNGKLIVIFNKLEEPAYKQHIIAYVGLDLCGRLQITEDTWQLGIDKAMPATKEQRDLLFTKMREAGYQWDADKKELSKIIKPKFKVGDSLQTGSYFTKILSINIEEERYYCDNRIISFKNQDLWHLVDIEHKSDERNDNMFPFMQEIMRNYNPPCYSPDGICTNPQMDCINCPKRGTGGTWSTGININKED